MTRRRQAFFILTLQFDKAFVEGSLMSVKIESPTENLDLKIKKNANAGDVKKR